MNFDYLFVMNQTMYFENFSNDVSYQLIFSCRNYRFNQISTHSLSDVTLFYCCPIVDFYWGTLERNASAFFSSCLNYSYFYRPLTSSNLWDSYFPVEYLHYASFLGFFPQFVFRLILILISSSFCQGASPNWVCWRGLPLWLFKELIKTFCFFNKSSFSEYYET